WEVYRFHGVDPVFLGESPRPVHWRIAQGEHSRRTWGLYPRNKAGTVAGSPSAAFLRPRRSLIGKARPPSASGAPAALSRAVLTGRAVGPVSGGFRTGTQRYLRGADAGISTDSKKRLAAGHRKQGSGGQTALLARRQADLFHTGPQWQPQRAGRALRRGERPAHRRAFPGLRFPQSAPVIAGGESLGPGTLRGARQDR